MKDSMNAEIKVLISRENDEVKIPTKDHENAGYDLYIDPKWFKETHGTALVIQPGETVLLPTGIRTVFPETHYAQVKERGSTGSKAIKYGAGVIDSNFRGIWTVIITNCGREDVIIHDPNACAPEKSTEVYYPLNKGIAQFVFHRVPVAEFEEVSPEHILSVESNRGEGMLGSSKK